MSERCPHGFDQALLSGHLDGELTQADDQRVRIHLEDCAACRALHAELRELREATMTTRFEDSPDSQWDERPRGTVSAASRGLGWILAVVWLLATVGYALYEVATGPENLFGKLIVFGGVAAFALLLLSVLIDRIRAARTDRYSEVQR
jgi:predicted anti-sigma-YlaC factor YlaD